MMTLEKFKKMNKARRERWLANSPSQEDLAVVEPFLYSKLQNQKKVAQLTFDFLDGNGLVPAHRHVNPDGSEGGWVANTAKVEATAYVGPDAWVYGEAQVCGDAKVSGDAKVCGNAWVYGNAKVFDDAWIFGNAKVFDDAWIFGDARVYGEAQVCGDARVYGEAQVCGDAKVCGNAWVYGNAKVFDDAWIFGDAEVFGNAWVCGNAKISGNAKVCGNAKVISGSWEKSPLYIQGSRHSVTHCGPDQIAIGCEIHSFKEWKKNYKKIGKAQGYTPQEIEEYGRYINLINEWDGNTPFPFVFFAKR